jgi:hypothetical protein
MIYAKQELKKRAAEWDEQGRPDDLLLKDRLKILAASCWKSSKPAQKEGVDPLVKEYIAESLKPRDGKPWYDRLLNENGRCQTCFTGYRLENLHICANCLATYCYRCVYDGGWHETGNRKCHCGGEIVG